MAPHSPSAPMAVCARCNIASTHISSPLCDCGKTFKWMYPSTNKRVSELTDSESEEDRETKDSRGKRKHSSIDEGREKRRTGQSKFSRVSGSGALPSHIQGPGASKNLTGKPKAEPKPQIAWCFKCHVGSHWSQTCTITSTSQGRAPMESNLIPSFGWQDHMLHPVRFELLKSRAPQGAKQTMHHIHHLSLQIRECVESVKHRDQVLERIVRQPQLLSQAKANATFEELPDGCCNGYEYVCARANKAGLAFMTEYSTRLRMLYNNAIKAAIRPNKDRRDQTAFDRRQEISLIANQVAKVQSDLQLEDAHFEEFRKSVQDAQSKYDLELTTLHGDWEARIQSEVSSQQELADAKIMDDIKYLPTHGFKVDLALHDTWLPVLVGPKNQNSNLLSKVFKNGVPKHLPAHTIVPTIASNKDAEMTDVSQTPQGTSTMQQPQTAGNTVGQLKLDVGPQPDMKKARADLDLAKANLKAAADAEEKARRATQDAQQVLNTAQRVYNQVHLNELAIRNKSTRDSILSNFMESTALEQQLSSRGLFQNQDAAQSNPGSMVPQSDAQPLNFQQHVNASNKPQAVDDEELPDVGNADLSNNHQEDDAMSSSDTGGAGL